ncbi:MAG: serine/threonine-protein kinase [Polyangiaceae bacterium]
MLDSTTLDGADAQLPAAIIGDRYQLGREIARGGMGVVCEARHLLTGRTVALKYVPRGTSDSVLIEARLKREAAALGTLSHVNIVEILDAGECPSYGFFLVMEKLEGRSLDGLLAARKILRLEEAVVVAREVGAGLAFAHDRGIVHRDVKSANVFVSLRPGEGERIKLIDFGVASVKGGTPNAQRLTSPGKLLGTIEYVAPEQLAHPELPNPRSDQYSLAMVLLECLTGMPLGLVDRISSPPAFPEGVLNGTDPTVTQAILRALSANPADRFESIAAFVQVLVDSIKATPRSLLTRDKANPSVKPAPPAQATTEHTTRRRHPRAPYITPCRVLFADGSHVDARSEDISVCGMLVVFTGGQGEDILKSRPTLGAAPGEQVKLRFSLPVSARIATLTGDVRWVVDHRGRAALGIEFRALEGATQEEIARYVQIIGQAG